MLHQFRSRLEADEPRDLLEETMGDAPLTATPTSIRMTVEAFRGTWHRSELDDVDKVKEDLIAQATAMFVVPAEEKEAR